MTLASTFFFENEAEYRKFTRPIYLLEIKMRLIHPTFKILIEKVESIGSDQVI